MSQPSARAPSLEISLSGFINPIVIAGESGEPAANSIVFDVGVTLEKGDSSSGVPKSIDPMTIQTNLDSEYPEAVDRATTLDADKFPSSFPLPNTRTDHQQANLPVEAGMPPTDFSWNNDRL